MSGVLCAKRALFNGKPLTALLLGMGLLHLVVPRPFARLIPGFRRRPGPARWSPLVGVFRGKVKMALDPPGSAWNTALWLRLPLQIPLVVWAVRVPSSPGRLR